MTQGYDLPAFVSISFLQFLLLTFTSPAAVDTSSMRLVLYTRSLRMLNVRVCLRHVTETVSNLQTPTISNPSYVNLSMRNNQIHLNSGCPQAFPSISTGIYGYPVQDATHIAMTETRKFLDSIEGQYVSASLAKSDSSSLLCTDGTSYFRRLHRPRQGSIPVSDI